MLSVAVWWVVEWLLGLVAAQPGRLGAALSVGALGFAIIVAAAHLRPWLLGGFAAAATSAWLCAPAPLPPRPTPALLVIDWLEPTTEECELTADGWLVIAPLPLCDRALPGDGLALVAAAAAVDDADGEWGEATERERLDWRGAKARVRILRMAEVQGIVPQVAWRALAPIARLRRAMRRHFDRVLDEPGAGLVRALTLGERSVVAAEDEARFSRLGALHVLSVSGLHLALVLGALWVVARRLLRPLARLDERRPVAAWVGLAVTPIAIGYALLTGAAPPTLRALCAVVLGALAPWLGRAAHPPTVLALAAWWLVAATPSRLFDVSLQLTLAATAGLLWGAARARAPLRLGRPRLVEWLRQGLWLSIGSFVWTAPLCAWHFGELAWTAPLGNLLIVPPIELGLLPLGLVDGLLAALGAPAWLLGPVDAALRATTLLVRCAAEVMASVWPAPREVATVWVTVAALTVMVWPARRLAWVPGLVALVVLAWPIPPHLTVTFLSVGHGDAVLVEWPDGTRLLVDGGGSLEPALDPGRRTVLPYLRRRGIGRLDAIALSHPHPDHANGLVAVAAHLDVGMLVASDEESPLPALAELATIARERRIRWRPPSALADLPGTTLLHPLRPDGASGADHARSENDNSLVVRVALGEGSLLLTGDIEAPAEDELVAAARPIAATILKVPHHGSRTSSSPDFLDTVAPALAVISAGRHNRWHLPNDDVLARYAERGITLSRTDRQGTLRARIFADGTADLRRVR